MKDKLIFLIWVLSPLITIGQTINVMGVIVDSTNQIGVPMVDIVLIKKDSTLFNTVTDLDGYFRIENLTSGIYSLNAYALGYIYKEVTELDLTYQQTDIKIELVNEILEPIDINWSEGFILLEDSLGNSFCIDGSKNKIDSNGLRQGLWVKYFRDYSDSKSKFSIGQKLWEGEYKDDLKHGEWIFYMFNGKIDKVEYYDQGELMKNILKQ